MQSDPSQAAPSDASDGWVPGWSDPQRGRLFERWLQAVAARHHLEPPTLRPASADASFRRYFRVWARGPGAGSAAGRSFIVMDAPPAREDVRPFVHVAGLITRAGLHAPQVLEADLEHGFLLLSDLGRTLYLPALQEASPARADELMREAMAALVRFQCGVPAAELPVFGATTLHEELSLFPQWCVQQEFGLQWTAAQHAQWEQLCELLVAAAVAQPVVAAHRDWMPRNLLVADPNPGILDFQDAAAGPLAYDVVSMLRDAFLSWEEEREIDWAVRYWEAARRALLPVPADFAEFWRALEWVGLQRHLRILGVFCRLKHRDGKPGYAEDLPRFFGYCTRVALRYRELADLLRLLEPMSQGAVRAGYTF